MKIKIYTFKSLHLHNCKGLNAFKILKTTNTTKLTIIHHSNFIMLSINLCSSSSLMEPKVKEMCNYYFPTLFMTDSRKEDEVTVVSVVVIHIKKTPRENHPNQGYNTLGKPTFFSNTLKLRWKYRTGKRLKKIKFKASSNLAF